MNNNFTFPIDIYNYLIETLNCKLVFLSKFYKGFTNKFSNNIINHYGYNSDFNYGINLSQSNIFVIDCDVKNGNNGIQQFLNLCEKHFYFPITFTVDTPSGGKHYYFQLDDYISDKLKDKNNIIIDNNITNIDLKFNYCVAPGSFTIQNDKQFEGHYVISNNKSINFIPYSIINEIYNSNFKQFHNVLVDISNNDFILDIINLDLFTELLHIIDVQYINERNSWRDILWAIKSLEFHCNTDLTHLCHIISQKSPKYDNKETNYQLNYILNDYNNNIKSKITYKTIATYAKISNIDQYKQIYKKYLNIFNIKFNEKDMANLFYTLYNKYLIYQNNDFYIYSNNEWILDNKYELLNLNISDILIDYLTNELNKFNNITSLNDNIDKYKNNLNKYIEKLKTYEFTNKIATQIKTLLKKENINIQFDISTDQYYNLHFKNGVFELNNNKFRKREFNDYITKYLKYDYIPYDQIDKKIHDDVFNIFKKIQPKNNDLQFMLGYLAYSLSGSKKHKIFKINIGYKANNGKSTELNIHKKVFPIYTTILDDETFLLKNQKVHKNLMCCLNEPIRLAYIEDISSYKLKSQLLKNFVSCDGTELSLDKLFSTNITGETQAKLIITSNQNIVIDNDKGIERRSRIQYYNSIFNNSVTHDDFINNIFIDDPNIILKFSDIKYKNAYFHLLLKYFNDFYISDEYSQNFINQISETDDFINDFYYYFSITNNDEDIISKNYICEILKCYTWKYILNRIKSSLNLKYDKDKRSDGNKGFVLGIKLKV